MLDMILKKKFLICCILNIIALRITKENAILLFSNTFFLLLTYNFLNYFFYYNSCFWTAKCGMQVVILETLISYDVKNKIILGELNFSFYQTSNWDLLQGSLLHNLLSHDGSFDTSVLLRKDQERIGTNITFALKIYVIIIIIIIIKLQSKVK